MTDSKETSGTTGTPVEVNAVVMGHFSHLEIYQTAEITTRIDHALRIVKEIAGYDSPYVDDGDGESVCFFCDHTWGFPHSEDCLVTQAKQVFNLP